MTEAERFALALERTAAAGTQSIGTQSERTLHRAVKYFLDPDEEHHELPAEGFIADVLDPEAGRIFEIQTRDFGRLRDKLAAFLPKYEVTVVYPVLRRRYLCWIDPETGELESRRKSPRTGSLTDILPELSALRAFFGDPRLSFLVILLDGEEYRLRDGWSRDGKRGSHGLGKTPFEFVAAVPVTRETLLRELAPRLPEAPFTRAELGKALRIGVKGGMKLGFAQSALEALGLIRRVGKRGNSILFELTKGEEPT